MADSPLRSVEGRLVNGARVRSKRPDGEVSPIERNPQRELTIGGTAYALAKANERKPWARRWLRQNGHFV